MSCVVLIYVYRIGDKACRKVRNDRRPGTGDGKKETTDCTDYADGRGLGEGGGPKTEDGGGKQDGGRGTGDGRRKKRTTDFTDYTEGKR